MGSTAKPQQWYTHVRKIFPGLYGFRASIFLESSAEVLQFMKTRKSILLLTALVLVSALVLGSCTSVQITHNYPDYIAMKLNKLPADFLNAKLVLDDQNRTLILEEPLTLTEFVAFMMLSQPIDPETYLTLDIVAGTTGTRLVFKEHKRNEVILWVSMELTYQDGAEYARIDRVIWDDKMMGRKQELTTLEEKAGFAALVFLYLVIQ